MREGRKSTDNHVLLEVSVSGLWWQGRGRALLEALTEHTGREKRRFVRPLRVKLL